MTDETLSETGEQSTYLPAHAEPQLYLVLECERPLAGSSRHSLDGIDEIAIGRGPERRITRSGRHLIVTVPDPRMSSAHARLRRERRGFVLEDGGSKNGTLVNEARVERAVLADGDLVEAGRTFFIYRDQLPKDERDDVEVVPSATPELVTLVVSLAELFRRALEVARSMIPVLLTGETGTGKEIAARTIHAASGRAGAFLAINCGALSPTIVEAELFGAKRGAYSGAVDDRPGLVRSAEDGTLMLDEIGDLPMPAQAALLRVLQEREVIPVGGSKPIRVDFRVIAATHRDLRALVQAEAFRADLYARLGGFAMMMPALRDRREDLGLLVASALRGTATSESVRLSPEAARLLFGYDWPQNIRELERCIETAVVLSNGGTIRPSHLSEAIATFGSRDRVVAPSELSAEDAQLRAKLVRALDEHEGNISAVAREFGRQRVQIHRWIRRLGIPLKR